LSENIRVAVRRVIPKHHPSQEFEGIFELLAENIANGVGLSVDVSAKGSHAIALARGVLMLSR
jgi:hypothetical protein